MAESEHPETKRFALHQIPNSLIVLLTVALLLQGPAGAFEALWEYTRSLAEALLGGEDLFLEVICQTAPLTMSAAVITFAFRCRWLTFRTPTSIVACSLVVLTATWLGGQLRSWMATHRPLAQQTTRENQPVELRWSDQTGGTTAGLPVLQASFQNRTPARLSDLRIASEPSLESASSDIITLDQALETLSDFSAAATDGGQHDWRETVPRVALIPETSSSIGFVARAFNQLFGYVVFYRPRLFLAAILLGTFMGWSWQPRLESLLSPLTRREKTV